MKKRSVLFIGGYVHGQVFEVYDQMNELHLRIPNGSPDYDVNKSAPPEEMFVEFETEKYTRREIQRRSDHHYYFSLDSIKPKDSFSMMREILGWD